MKYEQLTPISLMEVESAFDSADAGLLTTAILRMSMWTSYESSPVALPDDGAIDHSSTPTSTSSRRP